MNTTLVTTLALALILSNGTASLRAQSCNTTAVMTAPPAAGSPLLLKVILNPRANIRDRLEAAQFLGEDLGCGEVDTLYCFLKSHPDARENNMAGLHALKNDVINALKDQSTPPAGLTATLIGIYQDRAQDFVTRDYAIQHLTSWCGRGAGDAPDAKERIHAILREATQEHTTIAGTALLGLHRLSLADRSLNRAQIDRRALEMVTMPETAVAARITAVGICAERGVAQALPEIERLAQARGQTALQLSAIAALGKLGKTEDAALLRRLGRGADMALRPAIESALKRLTPALASRESF